MISWILIVVLINFRCSKISKVSLQPQVNIVIKALHPNSSTLWIITRLILPLPILAEAARHIIGIIIIITIRWEVDIMVVMVVPSQETSLLYRNIPISMVKTNPCRCLILHKEGHQALTIRGKESIFLTVLATLFMRLLAFKKPKMLSWSLILVPLWGEILLKSFIGIPAIHWIDITTFTVR